MKKPELRDNCKDCIFFKIDCMETCIVWQKDQVYNRAIKEYRAYEESKKVTVEEMEKLIVEERYTTRDNAKEIAHLIHKEVYK